MPDNIAPLPFGIPSLDKLLGYTSLESADLVNCLDATTSLAIVGQDGTGKSVFALHLAAAYQAIRHHDNERIQEGNDKKKKLQIEQRQDERCEEQNSSRILHNEAFVVYVSSDIRHAGAVRVWESFYLDQPWLRYVPFIGAEEIRFRREVVDNRKGRLLIVLAPCEPEKVTEAISRVQASAPKTGRALVTANVSFIDLSERTTGDDWLFVTRLVSGIRRFKGAPPNLLIIDSVAGFETLIGEKNSFGESMSRRARIAQLIRAAGDSWHTVFVVEEPGPGLHHPEEYVTDTVIHLKRYGEGERVRRIIEIEKSRSRSFASGEHPFEIRDGLGTSTGSWENPDDPRTFCRPEAPPMNARSDFNSYVQVFPSLHYLSKELAGKTRLITARELLPSNAKKPRNIPFGIPYLDNMLAAGDLKKVRGLPIGSITSLIGDEGTLKSSLAEQFLIEGFAYFPPLLDLLLFAVEQWLAAPDRNDINDILKNLSRREQFTRVKERLPDRLQIRLDGWLRSFETRQNKLKDLFNSSTQTLRSEMQLPDALREWPTLLVRSDELRAESTQPRRPLAPRWDERLYYNENKKGEGPEAHKLALALAILRISSGLMAPVVYISTQDTSAERISGQILRVHDRDLRAILQKHGIPRASESYEVQWDALSRLLERFIIVRRVELIDATGPQLWHIVDGCVQEALALMGNEPSQMEEYGLAADAGDIRFVLNDLRLIRDTYPSVASDPLFLPTVVFRLRRIGVTALLVDSENGRPDVPPSNAMNGALRSLVDNQIYTWKVPFFGEERVAISVIPPLPGNVAGTIRELRYRDLQPENRRKIDVDPNFSLYMGVEEGKPAAVPLEVILYAETPAFGEYIESERAVFTHLFVADRDKPVIRVEKTHDYDGLRDYCHLASDTRLAFTRVFAVDEFWAFTENASLRDEWAYLYSPLQRNADQEDTSRDYVDSFGLFRRTRQMDQEPIQYRAQAFRQAEGSTQTANSEKKRTTYYDSGLTEAEPDPSLARLDRVPFMWDFGFLLCNERQWQNAQNVKLPIWGDTVGQVWDRVRTRDDKQLISWRTFFEACSVVSQVETRRTERRTLPFDLATAAPESLSCCLLEIWLSEIVQDAIKVRKFVGQWSNTALDNLRKVSEPNRWLRSIEERIYLQDMLLGPNGKRISSTLEDTYRQIKRAWKQKSLGSTGDAVFKSVIEQLPGYSLQLYKTWLLLLEVLDFNKYRDPEHAFELKADYDPTSSSSASRHWYKTACVATANIEAFREDDGTLSGKIPTRLPGHFSVRGDWFLAVAKGSRSYSLGDRALDLLTSRRANRTRLHLGLGLPTRDVLSGPNIEKLRTRLSVLTEESILREFEYGELLSLGVSHQNTNGSKSVAVNLSPAFRWVFRSGFAQFDRQARVIQKWIHRMLGWTVQYRYRNRANWDQNPGFGPYDRINRGDFSDTERFDGFVEFARGLDIFIEDLNAASLADEFTTR